MTWQRRMAPFMTASIIVAAGFFAAVTLWGYSRFESRLTRPPGAPESLWNLQSASSESFDKQFELVRARATYELEREIIARRYDQATLMLSARLWTRLMGFITGMILALVGAAFVLGKLSEDTSELDTKGGPPGQQWSLTLRSSSPGIILAVLGSLLMTLSIAVQGTVNMQDQAIYFQSTTWAAPMPAAGQATSPAEPGKTGTTLNPYGLEPPRKE